MEYINIEKGYTKEEIEKIAEIIKNGKILVLPTDTVYGIAANALDVNAVKKIYELKKRNNNKPINILVSNIEMVKKAVKEISEVEEKIIEQFFPGALTIVFKKSKLIPDIVTSGLDTIGIRMPENKFLLELIESVRNANSHNKLQFSRRKSRNRIGFKQIKSIKKSRLCCRSRKSKNTESLQQ